MTPLHKTILRSTAKPRCRIQALGVTSLLAMLLLQVDSAFAWNAAGHRLVACIAWGELDTREQARIGQLLRIHPDYGRWNKSGKNDDRTAFIEASTWADEIRNDPRFYDAGIDASTPPLPGLPDTQRHRDWHYVNRPVNGPQQNVRLAGHIEEQLAALKTTLTSRHRPISEQAVALPWLIHLTGDAHQPLHVGMRVTPKGAWDKRGNGERIINPFNPRKRRSTLHVFWDDLPGPSWLRRQRLNDTCQALAASYPPPARSTPSQWIAESWRIARTHAYPPDTENTPVISAEFHQTASEIARRRIVEAGHRLAGTLHDALSEKQTANPDPDPED